MLNFLKNNIMSDKFKIINAPIFVTNIFCIIIFQAFPIFGLSQSYKSLVQKGNEFYENKSYAEAQTFFAEALKKKNNDLEVVVKLGECLWRCNKMYEANSIFSSIINDPKTILAIPFVVKKAWFILDKFLSFTNRCCLISKRLNNPNATHDNHPVLGYC